MSTERVTAAPHHESTSRAARPNVVLATGHLSGTGALRDALARHTSFGWIEAEDFAEVDGDERSFPLNSYDPAYTSDPEAGDAFEAIARRHAGRANVIAWQPGFMIEFPHVLWQVANHLPGARVLFCLRNPVDAARHRFAAQAASMPETFGDAVEQCIERMERDSRFEFRGRWSAFHAKPDPVSMLLQGGVYAPAVSRCLRLFPREQVRVVVWERLVARPVEELAEIAGFLDLQGAEFDGATLTGSVDDTAPMADETRLRLERFYAPFNDSLVSLLGWSESPWP